MLDITLSFCTIPTFVVAGLYREYVGVICRYYQLVASLTRSGQYCMVLPSLVILPSTPLILGNIKLVDHSTTDIRLLVISCIPVDQGG
jgi:hypothetical protein